MLISLVGGRIVPSFTRNWLTKARPEVAQPVPAGRFDLAALVVTGLALLIWAIAPDAAVTPWAALGAGIALALRLSRWRGHLDVISGPGPLKAAFETPVYPGDH
jgi:uncharacterized protein involved in response to NO